MADNNTVVLRIQLDEQNTEQKLAKLVLAIEANRKAQLELKKARDADKISATEYALQSVKLTNTLSDQRAEQRNLTKDLALYRQAVSGTGTSYKELQAALSLAQRQFQVLEDSADNGSEAAQELSKTIESLRLRLKATDEVQQNFARNIGNYPKNDSLDKLVQQLVLLQEQEKRVTAGTEKAIRVRNEIGFVQQAAIQRGAAEGKTYEQTTDFLRDYSEAIRPATANLLQLTEQQQQLAESGEGATEEVRNIGFQIAALGKQIKDTPTELPEINVPTGSLEELAQALVKIQEEQKGVATDSAAFQEAERNIKAYEAAAIAAGGEAGMSYDEARQHLEQYTAQVQPLVAELVKLEAEQAQVAQGSEAYTRLQVRISSVRQALTDAQKPTKTFSGGLLEAAKSSELFGGTIAKVTDLKEKYTKAAELAKLATAGQTVALGALRLALIATGLGAFLVIVGSLATYLSKTAEGTKLVENVMAQASAVVNVLTDRFGMLGKAIAQVFDGDFSGAAATAKAAVSGIADEVQREVVIAGDLSKAQQQLNRDRQANAATNKALLRDEENLKNVRDNEYNTLAVRRKANEDAFKVEQKREAIAVDMAKRQIAIYEQQIALRGGQAKADKESLDKLAEAQAELTDIEEDSAGRRNEYITQRFSLAKEAIDKEQELDTKALEKRIQLRKDTLALEAVLLDRQLKKVQANSDEELSLLQQKLRNGYQAELNVKNLTASAKKVIDTKYESESLALSLDFGRRRLLAALQQEADLTAAELSARQSAGDQELRQLGEQQKTILQLKTEQIEEQRQLSIAALAANADNDAKIQAINAAAAAQRQKLEYDEAVRLLQLYLENKRRLVENDYADGLIQEGEYQRRLAAIAKAGTDAQKVINHDYNQDNAENQRQADALETAARTKHTQEVRRQEEIKQEIRQVTLQAGISASDTIIRLFGEESAAGQAALITKKTLGLAEIALNLQKELSANALAGAKIAAEIPPPAGPILGTAYVVAKDALAIATAAGAAAEILKLQRGGIAEGPSHAQGGIPLYYQGRPAGIEIEGGEPVLTKRVSQNPLLLSIASLVNQAAGGRALVPSGGHLALGAITKPVVMAQLRGAGPQSDSQAIGAAVAKALRENPAYVRWIDYESARKRNEFTDMIRKA